MINTINPHKVPDEAPLECFERSDKAENPVALSYPINIRETEHKYELAMVAPGFKKSDFTVTSEGGLLTITAITGHEEISEDDKYTRKEFLRSSINRAFSLPEDILVDHVSAAYHDGMLTIDLKKNDRFLIGKKHVKVD